MLHSFGAKGAGPGQIGSECCSLAFYPDGRHLIVCEEGNQRMSVFTVEGTYVHDVGAGIVSAGHKEAAFCENGEIIVADQASHRICVFSADGAKITRSWGSEGATDARFKSPTAVAVAGKHVYVLDASNPRVQVFE